MEPTLLYTLRQSLLKAIEENIGIFFVFWKESIRKSKAIFVVDRLGLVFRSPKLFIKEC